ncbi:helix-turn-helix domain-containing protein [Streptomyces milbemycinicus]|uniref:helix-turn-helix domain-containing protein n=1 Tax=Streptomyces milbemycinicus TaxID=476552 RepID=UPI000A3A4AF8|nr:helix-turn-helix transcriptional regulator [Streptomyces milbemycinicus]
MADHQRRPRGAPLNHVPEAVTFARERSGLTKRALAERCGFSEQLLNDIESGRRNATPAKLRILSAELNCPLVVLEARRAGVPEPVGSGVPEPVGSAAA